MPVVAEEYVQHFDKNFSEIKDLMYEQVPKDYDKFVREESMTGAFTQRTYIGGLGMPKLNRDLEAIPLDEAPMGLTSRFVPKNFRLGYQIDRSTIEDEQFGLLANRPTSMLYGSNVIRDLYASDLLNNGRTVNAYDLGGLALFDTAHVREDGAATWSNRITSDLPLTVETAFQAIIDLLYNLKDTRGFAIPYNGVINIYVPSVSHTLMRQATEVANSVNNPGTSDQRINALTSKFSINVVPLRYITSTTVWYVGWQPSSMHYGLVLMNRVNPEITPLKSMDNNPDAWYSRLRMRFTVGYENKRGIGRIGA
jgi:hypothetical protein